jgi:hypothetical protein
MIFLNRTTTSIVRVTTGTSTATVPAVFLKTSVISNPHPCWVTHDESGLMNCYRKLYAYTFVYP